MPICVKIQLYPNLTEKEFLSMEKDRISFKKDIPVIASYDVAVCGGGPAGFIAAIAAARNGARVALIERYGFLGGAATAALVNPISTFKKDGEQVIGGIPWEFVTRLASLGGADDTYPNGNVPMDAERYKLVAQRMVLEAGVTLYLHSVLVDVCGEKSAPTHIVIQNKSGLCAIAAKRFIDCTGDADLCHLCGFPMQEMPSAEGLQPASLCLRIGGVRTELVTGLHPSTPGGKFQMYSVREALEALTNTHVPNFGGPWFCTVLNDEAGVVSVNITRTQADATSGTSVTAAECQLREDMFTLFSLLKEHIPAFADAYLLQSAPQAGFRESRRIRGNTVLRAADYANAVHFEDSVARGAHPIDIHRATDSKQDVTFLRNAGFVPYRTLVSDACDNVLAAGRCISADREAFASIRVQATAMALGQAAGTAAALSLQEGCTVSALSVARLRETLKAQGAII